MLTSLNFRSALEKFQPVHKAAFYIFLLSFILIEALWSGEGAFFPFITYKDGLLPGQWQSLGQTLSMVGNIISPFLAAHLLRHRHYILLVLLGGVFMVGTVFYFKVFEHSKLESLSFAWVSLGTGLTYTLVKMGLNKSMPLTNTFFVWTCVGILSDLGEGIGIQASGSLLPLPFLTLMGAFSLSVVAPLFLFRSICMPLFPGTSPLLVKQNGGEVRDSILHVFSCLKQLPLPLSLSGLLGFLNIWTLFSEYSVELGFSRNFYSELKIYILICTMIVVPLFSFASRKWTTDRIIGGVVGVLAIGGFLMLSFKNTWTFWIGATLLEIASTALSAFISHLLTQESRNSSAVSFGFGFALVSLIEGLTGSLGSFINQWIFDTLSSRAVSFFWGGLSLCYLGWFLFIQKKNLKKAFS